MNHGIPVVPGTMRELLGPVTDGMSRDGIAPRGIREPIEWPGAIDRRAHRYGVDHVVRAWASPWIPGACHPGTERPLPVIVRDSTDDRAGTLGLASGDRWRVL